MSAHEGAGGVKFWPATDVGKVRKANEDAFLVDRKLNLFVVCDGMGGHAAGEVASNLAAKTFRDHLAKERDTLTRFAHGDDSVTRRDLNRLMEAAVQQACTVVHQAGVEDESKRGMGTTLDALLVQGSRGFIAHVGDSRVYLYRQGAVHQLTEDHSIVNELIRRGKISREQANQVQYKNAVTRAVGVYESVEVDVFDFDVLPGDRFLLCSDGLHGYLAEAELKRLFEEVDPEELTPSLIALANDRGGKDNITAICITLPEDEKGVDKLTREVNLKLDILHRIPLFRYVSFQELIQILNITHVRAFAKGEIIVSEGQDGDEFFVVLTGGAKVSTGDTILGELRPGEHFGELALVDKAPRSATVRASQDSKLLVIKRSDFFELIRRNQSMGVNLLWSFLAVIASRLRSTNRQLSRCQLELLADREVSDTHIQFPETVHMPDELTAENFSEMPDLLDSNDTQLTIETATLEDDETPGN